LPAVDEARDAVDCAAIRVDSRLDENWLDGVAEGVVVEEFAAPVGTFCPAEGGAKASEGCAPPSRDCSPDSAELAAIAAIFGINIGRPFG
jgi:hypothetical protein